MGPAQSQVIAKGHVVWVCQAGDSPVACRGQTGQRSCGMGLEGRVVPDRKEESRGLVGRRCMSTRGVMAIGGTCAGL